MSEEDEALQPGERLLLRIDRGREWHHYVMLVLPYLLLPLLLWMVLNVLLPILSDLLPGAAGILVAGGFLLVILAGMVVDMLHFERDFLARTDRRVFGRTQGPSSAWVSQTVDLPLTEIESVAMVNGFLSPTLEIRRKGRKPAVQVRGLRGLQGFAMRLNEAVIRLPAPGEQA
jgi:hypothetical protein